MRTAVVSYRKNGPDEPFSGERIIDTFRYFHPEPHQYTWWSFRANARANNKGWRIDYCMATQEMKPLLRRAEIWPEARHSDHCPCMLEIAFP